MSKKVNINTIKSLNNKTFSKKKVQITAHGQDFDIHIDEVFRPSKCEECLQDLTLYIEQCQELGINGNVLVFGNLVLIKHFTDIPFSADHNVVKDLEFFRELNDAKVVEQLFGYFNENELKKIENMVFENSKNLPKAINLIKEQYNKVTEAINGETDGTV